MGRADRRGLGRVGVAVMGGKHKRKDRTNLRQSPELIAPLWPAEKWRPIAGFPYYFVSNYGRVCSVDRIASDDSIRYGCVLRPGTPGSGHLMVTLGRDSSTHRVHVLVLEAFVGPRPEGQEGLHWDDNPINNWLSNLRWGTHSENQRDAVRNGKRRVGEQSERAKLNDEAVRYIRANPHISSRKMGISLGVATTTVKMARDGLSWKHVI